jgi:hypothetical protein
MASYREMDAVGRDRARFVSMAKQCLALPVNEWEAKFLDGLIHGNAMMGAPPERLSVRQAETLFEIRDKYELHATLHGGFSIPILIRRVYEGRLDLSEDDEAWITTLRSSGVDKLRRPDAGRLRRCAIQIGENEPYMEDA